MSGSDDEFLQDLYLKHGDDSATPSTSSLLLGGELNDSEGKKNNDPGIRGCNDYTKVIADTKLGTGGCEYCRSPADLVDIFSDFVDDLTILTGLSNCIAPLTDQEPHKECFQRSFIDYLRDDIQALLNEDYNACGPCDGSLPLEPILVEQEPQLLEIEDEEIRRKVIIATPRRSKHTLEDIAGIYKPTGFVKPEKQWKNRHAQTRSLMSIRDDPSPAQEKPKKKTCCIIF